MFNKFFIFSGLLVLSFNLIYASDRIGSLTLPSRVTLEAIAGKGPHFLIDQEAATKLLILAVEKGVDIGTPGKTVSKIIDELYQKQTKG